MKIYSSLTAIMLTTTVTCALPFHVSAQENRQVVRTQEDSILLNTFGNCVRTKWDSAGDPCAPEQPAQIQRPTPQRVVERAPRRVIAQEERTIYFGFNQAKLTPESKQKLDTLANTLKSEQDVKEARIIGYADRIGSAKYNEKLSQKRAEAVKKHIVSQGFVNARVAETRWLGENAPVTSCPDTMKRPELIECLQKDRRVEVEIDYLPETKGTGRHY